MIDPLIPPPFEVAVDCDGAQHWVEVVDGVPYARAHDVEAEHALGIMGADLPPCMRFADAVLRAPQQCDRNETWRAEAGARPPPTHPPPTDFATLLARHPGFFTTRQDGLRSFAEHYGEPVIDTDAVPQIFRRLAVLRNAREAEQAVADGLVKSFSREQQAVADTLVKKFAACTLAEGAGLIGARLEVGEIAGIGDRRAGMQTIVLPRRWLATVWVFGLERVGERFTLDLERSSEGLELVQIDQREDLSRSARRRTLPWPSGLRPIGARA